MSVKHFSTFKEEFLPAAPANASEMQIQVAQSSPPDSPGPRFVNDFDRQRFTEIRAVLELIPAGAKRVYVGKASGRHTLPQDEINALPRPAPYEALDHPFNLSIGKIEGGNWASSVPAHAILEGRVGFPPGMRPDEVMTRVRQVIAEHHRALDDASPAPRVEFHGFRSEGLLVDLETPGIRLLSRCHEDLVGEPPAHYLSTCTTDLRAFHVSGGINGTCYGPVAQRIHGIDECVEIDSIRRVLTTYALFIHRWARLAETGGDDA